MKRGKTRIGARPRTDSRPLKIREKLFLGDIHAAGDAKMLDAYDIVAIVNVGGGENLFPEKFAYLKIVMPDAENAALTQHLDAAVAFIEENRVRGGVLVHCKGGICRSASFLIAYLAKSENLSVTHAHGVVRGKKPTIRPRLTFLSAIEKWLNN
jgi:protein-tyrosine phosphatase